MNNNVSVNETFCWDLPIAIVNKTFCGLTEKWSPRFDHGGLLAMTITPVLVYWLILFLMVKQLFKSLYLVLRWRREMTRNSLKAEANLLKHYEKSYPNEESNKIQCRTSNVVLG